MKKALIIILVLLGFVQCTTAKKSTMSLEKESDYLTVESVRIANDSLEYEIIIQDIGFPRFLNTQQPQSYFDISFLERKNNFFVAEYNRRVMNIAYSRDLYPQRIEYDTRLRYGKEVNYLLYQYFKYFSREYNQKFIGLRN